MNNFLPVAYAAPENQVTQAETKAPAAEHGGLSIQPTTVAFHALNFVILLVVLNLILYKPLTKLLREREQKIKEGVENAEKAENMLKESNTIRQDMMKRANAESQELLEKGRKAGEEMRTGIIAQAQEESAKIVKSGHQMVETEKAKASQELKNMTLELVVKVAEKYLSEKIDMAKDQELIQKSINSYSA